MNQESAEKISSGSKASTNRMNGDESDISSSDFSYAGFLDQLGKEGLKGKIKRFIFHFIGFFAWWQEQINRTIRKAIVDQQARVERQEVQLTELRMLVAKLNAIVKEFQEQPPGKDKRNEESAQRHRRTDALENALYKEELEQRLARIDLLESALYKELSEQKAELARHRRRAE